MPLKHVCRLWGHLLGCWEMAGSKMCIDGGMIQCEYVKYVNTPKKNVDVVAFSQG